MARLGSEAKMKALMDDTMHAHEYLSWACSEMQTSSQVLLSNLKALTQSLAHEALPEQKKLRQIAENSYQMALQMHRIQADMLSYSRIRGGSFPITESSFSLGEKVDIVYQAMVIPAETRGLHLRMRLYGESNVLVADEHRLEQILLNLLDVMITYGKGPHIDFFVLARGHEQNQVLYDFHILDHQLSLSKEDFALFMNPFASDDATRQALEKYPLIGMKLFLAQFFLSQLHGKLNITASERGGTHLCARLWMKLDLENYPEQVVRLDPTLRPLHLPQPIPTSSLQKLREMFSQRYSIRQGAGKDK